VVTPSDNSNYEAIFNIIRQWSDNQRFHLVQDVLQTLAPPTPSTVRRKHSLEHALGLLQSDQTPPTDAEVADILDEHRQEKYT
jgi:hypothetical protein